MSWATVAVSGTSALLSGYKALKANSADKAAAREGASLKRPFYQIPGEYVENRNIAAGQAQGGLTAAEKTYSGEERERGLSSSLDALKQTGGGPNDFAQLNHIFDDSLKSEAAMDAQLHMKNIEFFTNANKDLAGQKATAFGINELQPYESKLQEIQGRRTAAQTNKNNAVDEMLGSLSAVGTGLNSRNPPFGGKTKEDTTVSSPYSRTFGLAKTGAGAAASPAASFHSIDTNPTWGGVQLPDTSDNY